MLFTKFFVGTDCTNTCDIKTDGTDKFVGHATVVNVADQEQTVLTFATSSSKLMLLQHEWWNNKVVRQR